MDFGEALTELKAGKTVMRDKWKADLWTLALVGGTLVIDDNQAKRPWLASHDCLLADDWEVVTV